MTIMRLIRAEIRKLTSTKMPLGFLLVLCLIAIVNGVIVSAGTDFDGTKTFISTQADQQSLIAFAANALLIASLFGVTAVAREHGHRTVVPTFLVSPRRGRAVGAQLIAVAIGGAIVGTVGASLTTLAVSIALPTTTFDFMVSAGNVTRVIAAAAFCGAVGAVLGAGIGAIVRNVGGAVTGTVVVLVIGPPLIVQTASGASPWMPSSLAGVVSGVFNDVSEPAAMTALILWAAIPAAVGLAATYRRDVL